MVARPSLKRVVPGSVPPWRALCPASARALKAFFSVLCASKSGLLLESKFGQISRALNLRAFCARPLCPGVGRGRGGAPPQLLWPSGRACSFPPARACFRGLVSGCRNVLGGRAVVFHFRQPRRRGSLSSSLRLIRLNFQAGGALQLNANSKSSPSRWGCFMKRFSADVVSCAQKFAATLLATYCLPPAKFVFFAARRFFAVRHLLRRSRCARALSPLCFRCVRFVELRWCGS